MNTHIYNGLPSWLNGKELTCNTGDRSSIPGLRRSPRERNGNPLQYSCWEILWTGGLEGYSPWGSKELDMTD